MRSSGKGSGSWSSCQLGSKYAYFAFFNFLPLGTVAGYLKNPPVRASYEAVASPKVLVSLARLFLRMNRARIQAQGLESGWQVVMTRLEDLKPDGQIGLATGSRFGSWMGSWVTAASISSASI